MTTTTDLRERIAKLILAPAPETMSETYERADAVLALISGPEPELGAGDIERAARAIQRAHRPGDLNEYVLETDWEINGHMYLRMAEAALKQSLTTQGGEVRTILSEAVECVEGLMTDFDGCTDNPSDASRLHEWDGILHDRFDWMEDARAALAHRSSDGWRAIDPERWFNAKRDTEYHRSQVQGFLYDTPKGAKTDKPKHHVIRDCTKKPGKQVIWSAFGDDDDYARLDAEMDRQIELYCTKLIADRYAQPPKHSGGETDG